MKTQQISKTRLTEIFSVARTLVFLIGSYLIVLFALLSPGFEWTKIFILIITVIHLSISIRLIAREGVIIPKEKSTFLMLARVALIWTLCLYYIQKFAQNGEQFPVLVWIFIAIYAFAFLIQNMRLTFSRKIFIPYLYIEFFSFLLLTYYLLV